MILPRREKFNIRAGGGLSKWNSFRKKPMVLLWEVLDGGGR
jgi:hypothetical protein